jgi:transcriptional regulator GlxA family with amidase domain
LSLKEVALSSGFSNADSLGRAFRAAEGITPVEYRRAVEKTKT